MSQATFICNGCGCELEADYSLRTEGFCFLCDPAITVDELLSDEADSLFNTMPVSRVPRPVVEEDLPF